MHISFQQCNIQTGKHLKKECAEWDCNKCLQEWGGEQCNMTELVQSTDPYPSAAVAVPVRTAAGPTSLPLVAAGVAQAATHIHHMTSAQSNHTIHSQ